MSWTGRKHTAETKAKMADARRRYHQEHPLSDEARTKMSAAFRGRKHTPETKAKMSAARMGITPSAETRAKIGNAHRGRLISEDTRAKIAASLWKDDDIGYDGAHVRARKVLPRVCARADSTCKGRMEVAFDHDTPSEFVKTDPATGFPFSSRPEDYMRLCASHHRRYDHPQDISEVLEREVAS